MLDEFRRLSRLALREGEGAEELSTRELELLKLVASSKTDKEIAVALSLSIHTIKTNMRSILFKLQVSGRKEAARTARDKGLMS